jgi:transposase-like protein
MTKPKKTRRAYTDEEKAAALAALAAEGGNLKKAARILDLSPSTLRGWRNAPFQVPPETLETATEKLDVLLEGIATQLAFGLRKPEAISRLLAKPVQAATVMGITADKLIGLRTKTTDESKMTLSEFLSKARWTDDAKEGRIVPSPAPDSAPKRPN